MAYTAPYIDELGMHIPTYNDILQDLLTSMKQIFGSDIYLDEDSMDYQQISIFARKIYDTNSLALLVYNNRTANTSVGVGLDNLCVSAAGRLTGKPHAVLLADGSPRLESSHTVLWHFIDVLLCVVLA